MGVWLSATSTALFAVHSCCGLKAGPVNNEMNGPKRTLAGDGRTETISSDVRYKQSSSRNESKQMLPLWCTVDCTGTMSVMVENTDSTQSSALCNNKANPVCREPVGCIAAGQ